jgi:hypothetical protein
MVESTSSAVYDTIEENHQQGSSETSGHVMLLQAETKKKQQAAPKKCQSMTLIWEVLQWGRLKKHIACTSYLTRLKSSL